MSGAFADAIMGLVENPNRYAEMSAYCKTYASVYDIGRKADELIKFYLRISGK